jgi:hypothetical protein
VRHPLLAELRLGEAGGQPIARQAGDWAVAGALLARHGEDLRLAGPDAGQDLQARKVFPIAGASMTTLPEGRPPPDHLEDKDVWSMFHHGTIGQKWPVAGRICHLLRVKHLPGGAADAS